jgi:hypothetical protein
LNQRWFPEPIWDGEPCYIIGGGPSLKGFQWECLEGRNVIGCTAAFYLGVDLVPIMIFGDGPFLNKHRVGLDRYAEAGGWVVTCANTIDRFNPPDYLKRMKKQLSGLAIDGLAWNGNTGSIAINLALLLGANPIYLLGYDMKLDKDGNKNFHNAYNDTPDAKAYNRFLRGLDELSIELPKLFPDRQVINLEDNTSALNAFPKESLKEHFSKIRETV